MTKPYRYRCACDTMLRLREEQIGKTGKCPHCGARIEVTRELLQGLGAGGSRWPRADAEAEAIAGMARGGYD